MSMLDGMQDAGNSRLPRSAVTFYLEYVVTEEYSHDFYFIVYSTDQMEASIPARQLVHRYESCSYHSRPARKHSMCLIKLHRFYEMQPISPRRRSPC